MSSNRPDKAHDKHGDTVVKRVSRRGHDDDHGGAWKVAFADFCLALMCLFLVLWVMAARQQERIQEVMRAPGGNVMDEGQGIMPETLGGPRGSLIAHEPMPRRDGQAGPTDAGLDPLAPRQRYETVEELQSLSVLLAHMSADAGLASNLQAVIAPYGLRVLLHDTERQGMFQRGSWVPSERFRTLLRQMGPLFARMDNQMLIVGHTDSLPYADRGHTAFSNWTLASNRAMTARSQLLAGGMRADSVLQVIGMADRAPLDANDDRAAVNRRIELLILTRQQARGITAMFGLPGELQPLMDGADSVLPDAEALRALRAQIVANQGGGAGAN